MEKDEMLETTNDTENVDTRSYRRNRGRGASRTY